MACWRFNTILADWHFKFPTLRHAVEIGDLETQQL